MVNIIYFFLMFFIASCSSIVNDTVCCINDDESYLKTDELCDIVVPNDLILPRESSKYKIPDVVEKKDFRFGKKLNICPPVSEY